MRRRRRMRWAKGTRVIDALEGRWMRDYTLHGLAFWVDGIVISGLGCHGC